jgi:hypothetical protein
VYFASENSKKLAAGSWAAFDMLLQAVKGIIEQKARQMVISTAHYLRKM